jgi:hypothetical protein
MAHILVWDLETIPDLKGYAAAHGHDGKTEDEIREALGDSAVKVERPLYPPKAATTVANCRFRYGPQRDSCTAKSRGNLGFQWLEPFHWSALKAAVKIARTLPF